MCYWLAHITCPEASSLTKWKYPLSHYFQILHEEYSKSFFSIRPIQLLDLSVIIWILRAQITPVKLESSANNDHSWRCVLLSDSLGFLLTSYFLETGVFLATPPPTRRLPFLPPLFPFFSSFPNVIYIVILREHEKLTILIWFGEWKKRGEKGWTIWQISPLGDWVVQ